MAQFVETHLRPARRGRPFSFRRRILRPVSGTLQDGEARILGETRVGVGQSAAKERGTAVGSDLGHVDAGRAEAGGGHRYIVDAGSKIVDLQGQAGMTQEKR